MRPSLIPNRPYVDLLERAAGVPAFQKVFSDTGKAGFSGWTITKAEEFIWHRYGYRGLVGVTEGCRRLAAKNESNPARLSGSKIYYQTGSKRQNGVAVLWGSSLYEGLRGAGFEPTTPSVSGRCSTTELTALIHSRPMTCRHAKFYHSCKKSRSKGEKLRMIYSRGKSIWFS